MRIVSYNIRLALDSSLERIAEVVRGLAPDVVCLQEVGNGWSLGGSEPVDMRGVLGRLTGLHHAVFAPALQGLSGVPGLGGGAAGGTPGEGPEGSAQYGIAVLSRWPLTVLERVAMPRTVDEPRVLLGLRVDGAGGSWLLVTSHVSVREEDRPEQLAYLTRWALTLRGRDALPMVVAGDLNAELSEPALKAAMGWLKVRSAHVVAGGAAPKSFPASRPELAIDHVLVSREWRVVGAGVAEEAGSDHFPVWAELTAGSEPC